MRTRTAARPYRKTVRPVRRTEPSARGGTGVRKGCRETAWLALIVKLCAYSISHLDTRPRVAPATVLFHGNSSG